MGLYVKNNFEETAIAKIKGRPAPDLGMSLNPEAPRAKFLEAEQEAKNTDWKEKTQKED